MLDIVPSWKETLRTILTPPLPLPLQFQENLWSKLTKMAENLILGLILAHWAQIPAIIFFIWICQSLDVMVCYHHVKKSISSEKTNDPILRKCSDRQTHRQTDGQTDKWFHRILSDWHWVSNSWFASIRKLAMLIFLRILMSLTVPCICFINPKINRYFTVYNPFTEWQKFFVSDFLFFEHLILIKDTGIVSIEVRPSFA